VERRGFVVSFSSGMELFVRPSLKEEERKKIKFELESLPHIEMMVVWSIRRKYQRTNMRKNHHHPLSWMMMMMTDHTHKRL
jgi:hypothetical protein